MAVAMVMVNKKIYYGMSMSDKEEYTVPINEMKRSGGAERIWWIGDVQRSLLGMTDMAIGGGDNNGLYLSGETYPRAYFQNCEHMNEEEGRRRTSE